ncbi:MAG: hypothetical protein Q9218_003410 [Villophora microphyllina]
MPPRLFPQTCTAFRSPLRSSQIRRRTLIAAPSPDDGPLMTRRSDRALPAIPSSRKLWLRTLPIFFGVITLSTFAIFNYQKASSSTVNATLYALRTSEVGKRELGERIYFRDKFPWIWGEMNQLHGRIDIRFGVKGTKGKGMMRFKSVRKTRMGFFETQVWSLELEDGRILQLLDEGRADDPFKNTALQGEAS